MYFTNGPGPFPDVAVMTGRSGDFTLSAPREGAYTLECAAEGHSRESVVLEAKAGGESGVEIRLAPV